MNERASLPTLFGRSCGRRWREVVVIDDFGVSDERALQNLSEWDGRLDVAKGVELA